MTTEACLSFGRLWSDGHPAMARKGACTVAPRTSVVPPVREDDYGGVLELVHYSVVAQVLLPGSAMFIPQWRGGQPAPWWRGHLESQSSPSNGMTTEAGGCPRGERKLGTRTKTTVFFCMHKHIQACDAKPKPLALQRRSIVNPTTSLQNFSDALNPCRKPHKASIQPGRTPT